MGLTRTTPPAVEPITLGEAKDHLRIDGTADDALLDALIVAAREAVESRGLALITQVWSWTLDGFPAVLRIPLRPVLSVDRIDYVDTAGASQLLAAAKYQTDLAAKPARIAPAYGETWPATRPQLNAVTVTFTAGFGAGLGDVPEVVRACVKLVLTDLYEQRGEVITGTIVARIPHGVDQLLIPYRNPIWG